MGHINKSEWALPGQPEPCAHSAVHGMHRYWSSVSSFCPYPTKRLFFKELYVSLSSTTSKAQGYAIRGNLPKVIAGTSIEADPFLHYLLLKLLWVRLNSYSTKVLYVFLFPPSSLNCSSAESYFGGKVFNISIVSTICEGIQKVNKIVYYFRSFLFLKVSFLSSASQILLL